MVMDRSTLRGKGALEKGTQERIKRLHSFDIRAAHE